MRTKNLRSQPCIRAGLALGPVLAFVAFGGDSLVRRVIESSAPAVHAAQAVNAPRVFFVSPRDGAEVSSDVELELEFGVENYEIAPVPEEFETPRADIGHFHLGVDTGCFAVGEVIPPGEQGWVHFGDGSNTILMQVEPGTMEFSVQIGDDEHRTREGLCETISVEVSGGL